MKLRYIQEIKGFLHSLIKSRRANKCIEFTTSKISRDRNTSV